MYVLLMSAATLGIIHTLLGPDHYLPFIVLSKARNWSRTRTMWITFISGVGHVTGSVVLGLIGIAMGFSLSKLESIEASRGSVVGWMLIVFGVLYSAYGLYKYYKLNPLVDFIQPFHPLTKNHLPPTKDHHHTYLIALWIVLL